MADKKVNIVKANDDELPLGAVFGAVAVYQYVPGKPLSVYTSDGELLTSTGKWFYADQPEVTPKRKTRGRKTNKIINPADLIEIPKE